MLLFAKFERFGFPTNIFGNYLQLKYVKIKLEKHMNKPSQ